MVRRDGDSEDLVVVFSGHGAQHFKDGVLLSEITACRSAGGKDETWRQKLVL